MNPSVRKQLQWLVFGICAVCIGAALNLLCRTLALPTWIGATAWILFSGTGVIATQWNISRIAQNAAFPHMLGKFKVMPNPKGSMGIPGTGKTTGRRLRKTEK